jgi:hypothetical protein
VAFTLPHDKAAFHAADIAQAVDVLHDKAEVRLRGGGRDVQDKVPAAGDMEQELHFGKLFNGFLESIEQFGGLLFEPDMRLADLLYLFVLCRNT